MYDVYKDKAFISAILSRTAVTIAKELQSKAPDMTPDELHTDEDFIPTFNPAKQYLNKPVGYVCKTKDGNIVRLLQPYDSLTFTQPPEELSAQWGYVWPTEVGLAKPFVASATSPYNKGDVCKYEAHVWRSGQDGNVWPPKTENVLWEDLGLY